MNFLKKSSNEDDDVMQRFSPFIHALSDLIIVSLYNFQPADVVVSLLTSFLANFALQKKKTTHFNRQLINVVK